MWLTVDGGVGIVLRPRLALDFRGFFSHWCHPAAEDCA